MNYWIVKAQWIYFIIKVVYVDVKYTIWWLLWWEINDGLYFLLRMLILWRYNYSRFVKNIESFSSLLSDLNIFLVDVNRMIMFCMNLNLKHTKKISNSTGFSIINDDEIPRPHKGLVICWRINWIYYLWWWWFYWNMIKQWFFFHFIIARYVDILSKLFTDIRYSLVSDKYELRWIYHRHKKYIDLRRKP